MSSSAGAHQRNPVLKGRLAELCRQEIQTVTQSFPSNGSVPAVTALALIAALHGLGSMGFNAAPDLDRLCEAAARLVFDRVQETNMQVAESELFKTLLDLTKSIAGD